MKKISSVLCGCKPAPKTLKFLLRACQQCWLSESLRRVGFAKGVKDINLLSFLATVSATFFFMVIYQRATTSKLDKQNIFSLLVLTSLAWWCVCDAFFYIARTKEEAWFWHQMGAPGWCGFIATTSYYFIVMTGLDQKLTPLVKAVFWALPVALVMRFMAARPTAFAEDLVQSGSGLGWTYVQQYRTIWPFVLLGYLAIYLGGALYYLYLWQKKTNSPSVKTLAKGFVLIDGLAVGTGFISIFVLPYFSSFLPPMSCLATLIFGFGYWGWLRDYDFLYVELALNPGYIFESGIDAMLVTDEEYRILYANGRAKELLSQSDPNGLLYTEFLDSESRGQLVAFIHSDNDKASLLNLQLKNGIPVICSLKRTKARKRNFKVCILCMYEISQLKEARDKLAYLANYDELTGLINRRRLGEILVQWSDNFQSTGQDFELLFLDLTNFKQVNDTFGHTAGDDALLAMAKTLQSVVSAQDVVARYAGDEFVVLHQVCSGENMTELAHDAVRNIDCSDFAPGFHMNVDIGSCLYSEAGSVSALYQIADARMYQNKKRKKVDRMADKGET